MGDGRTGEPGGDGATLVSGAVERVGGVTLLLSGGSSVLAETMGESVDEVRECREQVALAAQRLLARRVSTDQDRISLGCSVLDGVFGGGLARSSVSELTGPSGAGKTQLCLQMALRSCVDHADSRVVYVSTEGAVPTNRLLQLCQTRGHPDRILDDVLLHTAVEVDDLLDLFLRQLPRLAAVLAGRLRLVVVDSVAAPFRGNFHVSTSRRRAEQLQALGGALRALAIRYCLAVVCVNQVTACVGGGDSPTRPALGLAWSSQLNTRLLVIRTQQNVDGQIERPVRRLHALFSSYMLPNTAHFQITDCGVEGLSF